MLNYRFMFLSLGSARTHFHILACFHTILYTSAEPPFTSCVKCLILDGLFTTVLQGKPVCSDSWATAKQLFYEAHGLSFRELWCVNESPELNMFKLKLEPEQWVIPEFAFQWRTIKKTDVTSEGPSTCIQTSDHQMAISVVAKTLLVL